MALYGYARVYADKASGKDFRRPAWRELTEALQPGDVLAVKSIDRLGRNYDNIRQRQAEGIAAAQARGVRFGRPPKPKPKQFPAVLAAFERGELTRAAAARALKVSVTTFEKWRDEKRREQAERPAALSD